MDGYSSLWGFLSGAFKANTIGIGLLSVQELAYINNYFTLNILIKDRLFNLTNPLFSELMP